MHTKAAGSSNERSIGVTTFQDPKYELWSSTCLLAVDIFSYCNTPFKLQCYLWMPKCVWKSMWKYINFICLPNVLISLLQHPWKKWEVAAVKTFRLTTIQRQSFGKCSWTLHETFPRHSLLFSSLTTWWIWWLGLMALKIFPSFSDSVILCFPEVATGWKHPCEVVSQASGFSHRKPGCLTGGYCNSRQSLLTLHTREMPHSWGGKGLYYHDFLICKKDNSLFWGFNTLIY